MTIKKGTVLKGKGGYYDATYQGNVGDVHFVVLRKNGTVLTLATQRFKEYFELPKEQWVPEKGEEYWTILAGEKEGVLWFNWGCYSLEKQALANGLVYKTREEALDAVKRARGDV